jgi:hypothetical protein
MENAMKKKAGVLVIHGMGNQAPGYSDELIWGLKQKLGDASDAIVYKEIFYADIFDEIAQSREAYLLNSSPGWHFLLRFIKKFFIYFLSDNTSYKDSEGYSAVQNRLSENITALNGELEPGAPVIVAAHSLGVRVVSDYIYDSQKPNPLWNSNEFVAFDNIRALVSFGCNIPLFEMGHKRTESIRQPNEAFAWLNFYSPFDALGYKLDGYYDEEIGYAKKPAFITDFACTSGGLLTWWNVFCHNAYWNEDKIHQALYDLIAPHTL